MAFLTQQGEDAGQDSDEGSGTEACREQGRLGAAGLGVPIRVTVTHSDGEGVGAAEGRATTVHDQDREVVQELVSSLETTSLGQDRSSVIYMERKAH